MRLACLISKSKRRISVPFTVPHSTAEWSRWSRPFPTLVQQKIGVLCVLCPKVRLRPHIRSQFAHRTKYGQGRNRHISPFVILLRLANLGGGFPRGASFYKAPLGQLFGNFLSAQKVTPRRAFPSQAGQRTENRSRKTDAYFQIAGKARPEWSRPFPTLAGIGVRCVLWKTVQIWTMRIRPLSHGNAVPAPPKGEPWNGAPGNHCHSESLRYSQRESLETVRTLMAGT